MPHLSWQNLIVGDPLCAPFRQRTLDRVGLGDAIDSTTTLPALFSARRVARLKHQMPGVPERALQLTARAETLLAANDRAGARSMLEEATRIAPRAADAQFQLAQLYEQEQNVDGAIGRDRQVIAVQPRNGIALNNLAYALAMRRQHLDEALPLARRAVEQSPQNPAFLDTLAWLAYLTGDAMNAAKYAARAVAGAPQNPEVRLHAAEIYAAAGDRAAAETELREALKLSPALTNSEQVKQIRSGLERPAASPR